MLLIKNDEQIRVGVTTGLEVGSSSFTFDGTDGKKDYRGFEIVPSELYGRGILVKDQDYSWDYTTAEFNLLEVDDIFAVNQVFNIHFQPIPQPNTADVYSLINSSFFIRDINIPNATTTGILERVNSFITKYEPECLEKILGYDLYKLFITEGSQRMIDLAYGVTYQLNGSSYRWNGLSYGDYISLIANYVYYFYQKANAEQSTGAGTKVPKSEQGYSVSPEDKMISAWNFFSKEVKSMSFFLWNQKELNGDRTYPEFTYRQFLINKDKFRTISNFGF